jgi:hypothetical protein
MGHVVKISLALAALGVAAYVYTILLKPREARSPAPALDRSAAELPKLPADLRARLAQADDLEAGRILRDAWPRYGSGEHAPVLRRFRRLRGDEAMARLRAGAEKLQAAARFKGAAELAQQYLEAWRNSPTEKEIAGLLDEVREEESALVTRMERESRSLFQDGKHDAARLALRTQQELEARYAQRLQELSQSLERRIRIATLPHRPGRITTARVERPKPKSEPVPVTKKPPAKKEPAPPETPQPDPERVRREAARDAVLKARDLFTSRRHEPALEGIEEALTGYGDVEFVRNRREGLEAMRTLLHHQRRGVGALFSATKVTKKGRRLRLRYTFKQGEIADWEVLWTIAHQSRGDFEHGLNGIRGYGVTHLVHRAFFENDVSIRCTTEPVKLRTHGLAFCQHENETRQVMLLATNHWFYEGENYVKERPGHSLIFIGKGTNADVPVDSPDTGFIFLVTRPGPEARPNGTLDLSLGMKKLRIEAEVKTGGKDGQLRDDARGDDGRGIEKLRPALFVVENSVTFRDVVIEGLLHREFEKQRVQELWDLVSTLDE